MATRRRPGAPFGKFELATVLRFINAALDLQSEQLARLKAEPAAAG